MPTKEHYEEVEDPYLLVASSTIPALVSALYNMAGTPQEESAVIGLGLVGRCSAWPHIEGEDRRGKTNVTLEAVAALVRSSLPRDGR